MRTSNRLDLSVPPELFAAQLAAMQENGYTTITLDEMVDHLEQGSALPEKPVVLTFDDGYRDNYENAFPLLVERGMTATFFVVTDFIDTQRPEYLTWDMAREMQAGGMVIESHGRNHTSLKGRDDDFLIWQALGSAETIQFELGRRPHFVTYPAVNMTSARSTFSAAQTTAPALPPSRAPHTPATISSSFAACGCAAQPRPKNCSGCSRSIGRQPSSPPSQKER
ncbi:MAG: polysaccharide deacetylase family protein [Caldilineaceae bacterium]|nr:polysaccharide deacetylase family protein [Caldilineaceae bacterium]